MNKRVNDPRMMPNGTKLRILTLKTWPANFGLSWDGLKTWELRKNDREFQVGDLLMLTEFAPEGNGTAQGFKSGTPGHLTGRWVRQRVLKVHPLEIVLAWFPELHSAGDGFVLLSVTTEDRGTVPQKDLAQVTLDLEGLT